MRERVCRRSDCVRRENHHGHCFWAGRKVWRGDPAKPRCPRDPNMFIADCALCQADLAPVQASQPTEMEV